MPLPSISLCSNNPSSGFRRTLINGFFLLASLPSTTIAQGPISDPRPLCTQAPYTIGSFVFEIGGTNGSENTDFSQILTAQFVGETIAVVDLYGREIRLFDRHDGNFIRSIGRSGEGPGEFGAAPAIAPSMDGGLWAWDPGNRRLSLFALNGSLREEYSFIGGRWTFPAIFTRNAWYVAPSGDILSMGAVSRLARSGLWKIQSIDLISRHSEGPISLGPRDSTLNALEDGLFVEDPFKPPRTAAILGDRILVTQSGAWQIDVYPKTGRRTEVVRHPIPRTPITSAMKDQERSRLEQFDTPGFLELFDRLAFEDSASAIGGLKISIDGTIWVQRWHSGRMDESQVFDVLYETGHWLGTVRLPLGSGELADIGSDHVLTVRRDDFDVPHIRVYPLTRTCTQ